MCALSAKVRAHRLAGAHGGHITRAQLLHVGLSQDQIRYWIETGLLIRGRPKVYSLGHVRPDRTARLWEAVLYAGPDAYLTGACAAHHRGLINEAPSTIKVATPWRRRSQPGIIVLSRRPDIRESHHGLPTAPAHELLLELAVEGDLRNVRIALSNLDYRRELDNAALMAACKRGRAGSRVLRDALTHRLPQLAHCRSPLEVDFVLLLEAAGLPLPRMNVWLHGVLVDAYWPELRLVVELDGKGNHGTAAQKRRDAANTATLRGHRLTVVRLTWDDVHDRTQRTLATLGDLGLC